MDITRLSNFYCEIHALIRVQRSYANKMGCRNGHHEVVELFYEIRVSIRFAQNHTAINIWPPGRTWESNKLLLRDSRVDPRPEISMQYNGQLGMDMTKLWSITTRSPCRSSDRIKCIKFAVNNNHYEVSGCCRRSACRSANEEVKFFECHCSALLVRMINACAEDNLKAILETKPY